MRFSILISQLKIIEKVNLHPRNAHRKPYDFDALIAVSGSLGKHVFINKYGNQTIDFANPIAVLALNAALLLYFYKVKNWSIPKGHLCPPIPGRADYIHHIADLLAQKNNGVIPKGKSVVGLDIGVGANCIYPLLGSSIYDWSFVGSDILQKSLDNCALILQNNPQLIPNISLQQQLDSRSIFKNIISANDRFSFTMCNPPFHASAGDAQMGNSRKVKNLTKSSVVQPTLNFGGLQQELWCDGGELSFITSMIYESVHYASQCLWFTTLVSKKDNLNHLYKILQKVSAASVQTIEMSQGQKISRILAWTFMSETEIQQWKF